MAVDARRARRHRECLKAYAYRRMADLDDVLRSRIDTTGATVPLMSRHGCSQQQNGECDAQCVPDDRDCGCRERGYCILHEVISRPDGAVAHLWDVDRQSFH